MIQLVFKRVTTSTEAEILREIRNSCREYMTRNSDYISEEQQKEWFKTAHKKYELYIAYAVEHGAVIVNAGFGVIHKNDNDFMLTGGLLKDYRDKGLGKTLFKFLIDQCHKETPIKLEVLKNNIRAFKTYEALNFKIISETDKIYTMEYVYDSVI